MREVGILWGIIDIHQETGLVCDVQVESGTEHLHELLSKGVLYQLLVLLLPFQWGNIVTQLDWMSSKKTVWSEGFLEQNHDHGPWVWGQPFSNHRWYGDWPWLRVKLEYKIISRQTAGHVGMSVTIAWSQDDNTNLDLFLWKAIILQSCNNINSVEWFVIIMGQVKPHCSLAMHICSGTACNCSNIGQCPKFPFVQKISYGLLHFILHQNGFLLPSHMLCLCMQPVHPFD